MFDPLYISGDLNSWVGGYKFTFISKILLSLCLMFLFFVTTIENTWEDNNYALTSYRILMFTNLDIFSWKIMNMFFSVNRGIYRCGVAPGLRISSQSHPTKMWGLAPDRNWVHCGWSNRTHQRDTGESRVLCKMSALWNKKWLVVFVCTRVGIACALQTV